MARIEPFTAWRYASDRRQRLDRLICPPYDVISPERRARLAAADPDAFVSLVLPEPGDPADDRYAHAATLLAAWRRDGVLSRDPRPAFTLHRQSWTGSDGRPRSRTGLLGVTALDTAAGGSIRPHERTMAGPRDDRRRLMVATRAHLSPVFMLAEDAHGDLAALLDGPLPGAAAFNDDEGLRHEVAILDDGPLFDDLAVALGDRELIIADGHHRFESARACRDELSGMLGPDHPEVIEAGRMLVEVVSMASPGLEVLAIHRLLRPGAGPDAGAIRERLERQHALQQRSGLDAAGLLAVVASESPGVIGLALAGAEDLWTLRLGGPPPGDPVAALDAARLHRDVLDAALGVDEEAVATGDAIAFAKDAAAAVAAVRRGEAKAAFLLAPTPLDDLRRVTSAGLRMPQKTTYFYPKVPAGLAIHAFSD